MRKILLLLLAVAVFVGARRKLYPARTITVPSGESYEVMDMSRHCESGICFDQSAYLTPTLDSAAQRAEAAPLVTALGDSAARRGDVAFVVGALEPGPLRLLPPRRTRVFLFLRSPDGGWYLWAVKNAKATYHGWKEIG